MPAARIFPLAIALKRKRSRDVPPVFMAGEIKREIERWRRLGLSLDPDSGLPIGSVVRNHYGEYAVIGHRKVYCSFKTTSGGNYEHTESAGRR